MQTIIVNFGKYKDRPVTDLLADSSYKEWLLTQRDMKIKYPDVYRAVLVSELQLPVDPVSQAPNPDSAKTPSQEAPVTQESGGVEKVRELEKLVQLLQDELRTAKLKLAQISAILRDQPH